MRTHLTRAAGFALLIALHACCWSCAQRNTAESAPDEESSLAPLSGGVPITSRKNLAISSPSANHIWITVNFGADPPDNDTTITLRFFAYDFANPNSPVAVALDAVLPSPGTGGPPPPSVNIPIQANTVQHVHDLYPLETVDRLYRVLVMYEADFDGHRRWGAGWFEVAPAPAGD